MCASCMTGSRATISSWAGICRRKGRGEEERRMLRLCRCIFVLLSTQRKPIRMGVARDTVRGESTTRHAGHDGNAGKGCLLPSTMSRLLLRQTNSSMYFRTKNIFYFFDSMGICKMLSVLCTQRCRSAKGTSCGRIVALLALQRREFIAEMLVVHTMRE